MADPTAVPPPSGRLPAVDIHCTSRLRRLGNVISGVVLIGAGALVAWAGYQSVATALTTAGVHFAVQEVTHRLAGTPLATRLSLASPRARQLRHFGELAASVVMAAAGTGLALLGVPFVGTPLLVEGVELGVHAIASIREDIDCMKPIRAPLITGPAAIGQGFTA